MISDVRYACRHFVRSPGVAAVAVVTMGVGIAAATTIFAAVDGLWLRSLPYREPGRVVMVGEESRIPGATNIGYVTMLDWQARTSSFEAMAAYQPQDMTLSGMGEAEDVQVVRASAEFFSVLGVKAGVGRLWTAREDRPRAPLAVLSEAFWRRRFGGDANVVGRTVVLNERNFEVIGVMRREFRAYFAERDGRPVDVYVPLGYDASFRDACRSCRHLRGIARLRRGVSVEGALADLTSAHRQMAVEHADSYPTGRRPVVVAMAKQLAARFERPLGVLSAAAMLVLAIGCVNAAHLLLMRGQARRAEMAVRSALGATAGRLLRQSMTESVLLGVAGGVVGIVLTMWGTPLLVRHAPTEWGRLDEIQVRPITFVTALAIAVLAGAAAGLGPALAAARRASGEGLRGTRVTESGEHRWVRRMLAAGELGIAFALILGCGLLLKSTLLLARVEPGFRAHGLLTMNVNSVSPRYPREEDDIRFFGEVLAAIRGQTGIEAAAATSVLPLSGNFDGARFQVVGRTYAREADIPSADRFVVTADYLETMGIPVLRGRGFTKLDHAGSRRVALINEAAAKEHFAGSNAIGQYLETGRGPAEIVGVVGNVRQFSLDREAAPQFYLPFEQQSRGFMTLVIRGTGETAEVLAAARRAIASVDATRSVSRVATVESLLSESMAQRRFVLVLLGGATAISVVLALAGIYGALSFHVARRAREFGLRVALGATRTGLSALVARELGVTAAAGMAIGLALSLAGRPAIEGMLFEVRMGDASVLGAGLAGTLLAAAGACVPPLRRALRADAARLLREE
ncbi:MAG: ADOP family duplicated permease [Bryobacteraceae bacterium]|nr:ADOP family duplicated permease [Bryobacteraceae bacterium]